MERAGKAERIADTLSGRLEKKILDRLAGVVPDRITSDHMTWFGLFGAAVIAAGYALTNISSAYVWMASAGYVLNWLGDSLDGTLARKRKAERPVYGFYIDHNVDAVTILLIGIGAGLSPYISLSTSLLVISLYFVMCIHTYINTYIRNVFKISYGKLGPTEFRLVMIIFNCLLYFWHGRLAKYIEGMRCTALDMAGLVMAAALMFIFIFSFFRGKKEAEAADPPKWDGHKDGD